MAKHAASFPVAGWVKHYNKQSFLSDLVAAVIVAIMLIPQSLAYAMLAGLPPEICLYASIAPLIAYALLGTSSTLSVGPVAITSLMTGAALAEVAQQGTADYLTGAITLAALSGVMLLGFGLLRLGFLANFLSHTVVSAFITASALIIALSQVGYVLGIEVEGDNLFELVHAIGIQSNDANLYTLLIGLATLTFLFAVRFWGVGVLQKAGLSARTAELAAKSAPVIGVITSILLTFRFGLADRGVAIVGTIPTGLPMLAVPTFSLELIELLLIPAALISMIGYVESISVGRTLGAHRQERVDSNRELVGLGAANLSSAFSGALPVTGGFSRSVVNFDAGAVTQGASVYTAILIALVSLLLTPALYFLPKATLAATIIVAVLSLVDLSIIRKTWRYSRSDSLALLITICATLGFGVETGVSCGVVTSLALHLYRTSRPHIAEVGLVEGTEHFRNVRRYEVKTAPEILTLRVDESLFFANASCLEDEIFMKLTSQPAIRHVILMCSAVNEIDFSALEVLEELNKRFVEQGLALHLSEVKGPVLDRLHRTAFMNRLSGNLYFTQYQAFTELCARLHNSTLSEEP
ncbi:MAG: sulfate permease [Pseudomonadota bacterium]|nr:sulfate permease [Pseudomonadota bacterium]